MSPRLMTKVSGIGIRPNPDAIGVPHFQAAAAILQQNGQQTQSVCAPAPS